MESIIINGTEFIQIITNEGEGLLMHDLNDINRDGDQIAVNVGWFPVDEDDAEIITANEYWTSCFYIEDGVYYFD